MRYANYIFNARGVNNLGDNMQIIAIDNIYQEMGIKKEDIVYINTNDLDKYDGEYVVLPVTMPLVDYRENGVAGRFSDRIIPVFLGLTLVKETLLPKEIEYYNRFSPIGCRDERTLNTLRKYGIKSYLHGCITATLPLRNNLTDKRKKVYIVNPPKGIEQYIPKELMENVVYKNHLQEGITENPKEMMQMYYDEYKNNAALVITSLLHCSVPCMAAGIPVILAKDRVSYRMAWLEKLLKIYTKDEFDCIDWNASPVLYEAHKKKILELSIARIQDAFNEYSKIYDISYFYEDRVKKDYIIDACDSLISFIDKNWVDKNKAYQYSIWGLTQIGEYVVDYITTNYPNAKLCHAYDSFRQAKFCGLTSEHPDNIKIFKDETVFVATNGAEKAARELFEKIEKEQGTFAFVELVH